jgi:hypothetical protein
MDGGRIIGNESTHANASAGAGLTICISSTAEITGGEITSNVNAFGPADIRLGGRVATPLPAGFTLSGDAVIGTLVNYANNTPTPIVPITLTAPFTGSVASLHLGAITETSVAAVRTTFVNKNLILNATAADISRFPLGRFYVGSTGTPNANITDTLQVVGSNLQLQ